MKVLKADATKCQLVKACEKACSQVLHKSDQAAFSAVRVKGSPGKAEFVFCNQCGECIRVCPTGALSRNKGGTVLLRKDLCVGCLMCIGFCPYDAMLKAPGKMEPFKCISCGNCVKACPKGALALVEQDHSTLPS
jgi:anaerobic carbon-monoxide dehydrogenase iron sulfur subunit